MLTTKAILKAMEHIAIAQSFLGESKDPRLPAVVERLEVCAQSLAVMHESARSSR